MEDQFNHADDQDTDLNQIRKCDHRLDPLALSRFLRRAARALAKIGALRQQQLAVSSPIFRPFGTATGREQTPSSTPRRKRKIRTLFLLEKGSDFVLVVRIRGLEPPPSCPD